MRAFIAVHLNEEIRRAISQAAGELKPLAQSAKWVPPENCHLTLKFLGEIDPNDVERVNAAMKTVLAGVSRWQISVRGMGAFPEKGLPRVIWVGVDDPPGILVRIASGLNEGLSDLAPKERREFVPHVTIARLRDPDPIGAKRLRLELEKRAALSFGSQDVAALHLMESRLTPAGPIYSELIRVQIL